MEKSIQAVVLAAGRSTRMKSNRSKVLHEILGRTILEYLLATLADCGLKPDQIIVVVGENETEVRDKIKVPVKFARQEKQLGTADALLAATSYCRDFRGDLLVLVGDNPYLEAGELQRLIDHHRRSQAHCTMLSAVFPETPPPYGRVLRDERGRVLKVVEEIEASREELLIREVNSSVYVFDNETVFPLLPKIGNDNVKKEYYLTDVVGMLAATGKNVQALPAGHYRVAIGINNRWELQEAQAYFNRQNLRRLALEKGVTVLQPETVTVEHGAVVGPDTIIQPLTYIGAGTEIGAGCIIGPLAVLRGEQVPDGARVTGSFKFEKNECIELKEEE